MILFCNLSSFLRTILRSCLLVSTTSDYHTPESYPENPRWTWGTHPCLLVELREKTVYKNGFAYLQYLNSAGMNLNWARIKLREKENQLSSWYDRGPLNSVIILWKHHNILERFYFGTRKHISKSKMGEGRQGGGCNSLRYVFFGEASLSKTLA